MIEISVNPVAFSIGPINIGWYGIFVALAVLTVVFWSFWQMRNDPRVSRDAVANMTLVAIPSGVIFSRLLHVIDLWPYYSQHLNQIVGGAGLTIYGAVLGATLGVWFYSRVAKQPFGHIADMVAPGIILAQAIGRVGCTLNGCCYGVPTSLPWAVTYTNPASFAYAVLNIPVQPTQVYEIIYNLLVFGILFKLRGKLAPDGALFAVYLSLYALWRFLIDFIRDGNPLLFGLDEAQLISLVVLAIAVPFLTWKAKWVKKEKEVEAT